MYTENNEKTSLKVLIENEAAAKPYRYDELTNSMYGRGELIPATKKKYERMSKHHEICQFLVRISKENDNYPYSSLVHIAIGKNAHKQLFFNRGYKNIDLQKTMTIMSWLNRLSQHCKNKRFATHAVVVAGITKFYETVSNQDTIFNTYLERFVSGAKKPSNWKKMEDFYTDFIGMQQ